ncbi:hypothetical protein [Gordonia sp. NB41Y]|uniref:hypothetical protein n=1 Tax=Gordonia sp. NB41Y TaxID=875808 RepID=UPI0002BE274D|nr:hypothetical protein [Gordonia sp. NB41Y]EMP14745.1 hypothetical protein ISGA_172 [Gordonia sp. NB41Y]WLP90579.1 hypothetical protein Q9K23_24330 [Gordonia sp. NB41Y]
MGPHRKRVQLAIDGTDITVSIFPDTGEVRVTSAQQVPSHEPDGQARESGYTVVVKPDGPNAKGRERGNRATYRVTEDLEILPVTR